MRNRRTFSIEGMTCDYCAVKLKETLQSLAGIRSAAVSFAGKHAEVEADGGVTDEMIVAAARRKGYRARRMKEDSDVLEIGNLDPSGSATFDLVIIGSGGAAFGAALKASELGARVAMVERGLLGGTCVNIGCIPSKTLIRAAESLHRAKSTPFRGVAVGGTLTNLSDLIAQKDALVASLREQKYEQVLRSLSNVQLIRGRGQFIAPDTLGVGDQTVRADRFLVATGARPNAATIPGLAEAGFLTSTEALDLRALPPSLLVLGGRYIALELGQAFSRLGSRVTIIQRADHILPTEDQDLTEALADYLRGEGIEVLTAVQTRSVTRDRSGYHLNVVAAGKGMELRGAQLLVATGRRPNSDGMGLERIGVSVDANGAIVVDETLQTTVPGIYAAGDVIGDPSFVYTAAYEGSLAAENALTGRQQTRDYSALPWVMFTDPQVAVVGLNERRAKEAGIEVDVVKLPMSSVPRALAAHDQRGFVKLIKERGGDRLLGASILAPEAGDLIMEPALAIRHGIGVSELASAFHPYLTQIEAIKLAAQSFSKDVSKLSCCAA